mmetsp:Transcript_40737/g.86745  ORF Transcript_40737/g.86745 Transcript_40737/m.86745 type:complete len:432 (-) Transcript_40737:141-1436(-)
MFGGSGKAHGMPMSIPARALFNRLHGAAEVPSWTPYLPQGLKAAIATKPQVLPVSAMAGPPGNLAPPPSASVPPQWSLVAAIPGPMPVECDMQASCVAGVPPHWTNLPTAGAADSMALETGAGARGGSPAVATGDSASRTVLGSVWPRARDPVGCREVQTALDKASSNEERNAIAMELRGHVWEALRCPHANYVVQKCIATMPAEASQFIIDEIIKRGPGSATQTARHRFGCRILERLFECCKPSQVRRLVEDIVSEAAVLSTHPYGNYVVQHVVDFGEAHQQRRLAKALGGQVLTLAQDSYGSAVVAKVLSRGDTEGRVSLARAAATSPGLLVIMARTRHGHVAVRQALQLLKDYALDVYDVARGELERDGAQLCASRYGRFVIHCLDMVPKPLPQTQSLGSVDGAECDEGSAGGGCQARASASSAKGGA